MLNSLYIETLQECWSESSLPPSSQNPTPQFLVPITNINKYGFEFNSTYRRTDDKSILLKFQQTNSLHLILRYVSGCTMYNFFVISTQFNTIIHQFLFAFLLEQLQLELLIYYICHIIQHHSAPFFPVSFFTDFLEEESNSCTVSCEKHKTIFENVKIMIWMLLSLYLLGTPQF